MVVGENKSMVSNRYGMPMYARKMEEGVWGYDIDFNSYGGDCKVGMNISKANIQEANAEAIRRLDRLVAHIGGIDNIPNTMTNFKKSEDFRNTVNKILGGEEL